MTPTASADITRRLDIIVRRGDSLNINIAVKNEDDEDFDFTDYEANLSVFTGVDDKQANLVFANNFDLVLTEGNISLTKTLTQMTAVRNRGYIYFLKVTYPDGKVHTWLSGKFIVNEDISDNPTTSAEIVVMSNSTPVTLTIGF